MPATDADAAPYLPPFLDMLDTAFRHWGVAGGLPLSLRDAVTATPRHRFVHRFRLGDTRATDGPVRDADADPAGTWPDIYSDAIMRHVDAAGAPLPSTNSQPSYVLFLLDMLGLEPGQSILEIGSGSGWLAAVIARLVGAEGRVTGVELIADLAAQSRADLAALGLGNVTIVTGDGTRGHDAGAPYHRAMITAGVWDLPAALFDQVVEGGRVLVPIELRSGDGCDVTVFRRRGAAFVAERAVPGWFVPLLGHGQDRPRPLPGIPPDSAVVARHALPLGLLGPQSPAPVAAQFRAFLSRTEPGFIAARPDGDWHPGKPLPPFGLRDEADGSMALWQAGEIVSYDGNGAANGLARAYARWAALGLPGLGAFQLEIYRTGTAPIQTDQMWIEPRGETVLAWRLKPTAESWHALVDADER